MMEEQETPIARLDEGAEGSKEIKIEFADTNEDASVEEESNQPDERRPFEEPDDDWEVELIDEDFDPPVEAQSDASERQATVSSAPPAVESSGIALAEFQNHIDALMREKNSIYDQLLRRQAEFENFRKRTERDRTEIYTRARAEVVLELLPVIDNFERAIVSFETGGEDAAGLRHGIELIHKQFKDVLTKLGLEPVEAVGRTFDPHVHEAVAAEVTTEHEENTIIAEFERGYKLGDRLLRPAKVKVASNPE